MIVLAELMAATAMRVGGGAPFGIGGEGRAGCGLAGGVDRGGEREQGFITRCPAPPLPGNWNWRWWWRRL